MRKFLNRLGLTKKEIMILAFLFIALISGLVIKYSGWKRPAEFDYSVSDRNFEKLTKESFEKLDSGYLNSENKLRAEEMKRFADSLYSFTESEERKEKRHNTNLRVNINTALAKDLSGLPGIGTVMAERIIEYRENNGSFRSIEEIKKVKGIGEKKFELIKNQIFTE